MSKAYGFIEITGVVAAINALDIMCKTADVELASWERKLGGRLVTLIVEGEELAQRGRVPALDPGEVEALEGLGLAPGQPAQPQQRLDGGEPPLLRKVGEGGGHGGHLPVAEVEVRGEGRELLRPDGDPEPRRGVASPRSARTRF